MQKNINHWFDRYDKAFKTANNDLLENSAITQKDGSTLFTIAQISEQYVGQITVHETKRYVNITSEVLSIETEEMDMLIYAMMNSDVELEPLLRNYVNYMCGYEQMIEVSTIKNYFLKWIKDNEIVFKENHVVLDTLQDAVSEKNEITLKQITNKYIGMIRIIEEARDQTVIRYEVRDKRTDKLIIHVHSLFRISLDLTMLLYNYIHYLCK